MAAENLSVSCNLAIPADPVAAWLHRDLISDQLPKAAQFLSRPVGYVLPYPATLRAFVSLVFSLVWESSRRVAFRKHSIQEAAIRFIHKLLAM